MESDSAMKGVVGDRVFSTFTCKLNQVNELDTSDFSNVEVTDMSQHSYTMKDLDLQWSCEYVPG